MYGRVRTKPCSLDSYRDEVGEETIAELRRLAQPLKGARVLHLNVTEFGTGVAELLACCVPLQRDLGLRASWQVIRSSDEFLRASSTMYEALAGGPEAWSTEMEEVWRRYNEMNAALFREDYDFIVIHDPQPAALLASVSERLGRRPRGRWVWHCHLDISQAQPQAREVFDSIARLYDAVVVDAPGYIPGAEATVVIPAIDPLNPKNVPLAPEMVEGILARHGLDPKRPLICQLSPFDRWNDPLGLIDVQRRVRVHVPGLQLALVSTRPSDDPETNAYYREVVAQANADPDVFFFSRMSQIGNTEVNALQRGAQVVVQRSIRRGFSLSLLEAAWKGQPVVAGTTGELPQQVANNVTGYLVGNDDECAERLAYLLEHPEEGERLGEAGRERVREAFLVTRHLRDYLDLLNRLAPA